MPTDPKTQSERSEIELIDQFVKRRQKQLAREQPEKPIGDIVEHIEDLPSFQRWEAETDAEREQREGEAAKEREVKQQRERGRAWTDLVRRLGTVYADCRLETFSTYCDPTIAKRQQAVLVNLRGYAARMTTEVAAGRNVLLLGPSGTGKDHLFTALARTAIFQLPDSHEDCDGTFPYSSPIRWTRGSRFYLECRQAMGESEVSLISQYAMARILYFSDPLLPIGGLTPHQAAMFYEIIDDRYRHKRPTWVSLNVKDRAEAEERMGGAIIDRLAEGALTGHCDWPSWRERAELTGPDRRKDA